MAALTWQCRCVRALLIVSALLTFAFLGTCRPYEAASGSSAASDAVGRGPASGALIDKLGQPVALDRAEETSVLKAVLEGLELSGIPGAPAIRQPRPPLAERPEVEVGKEQLYAMFAHRLLGSDEVKKGDTSEALFRLEPILALADDGTATLTFETLPPISGASVYIGHRVPEDPLGLPRYRQRAAKLEALVKTTTGHRGVLRFDVKPLLRVQYDVSGVLERKGGVLVWRLELLDGRAGTSFVFDGETAFRCDPCQGPQAIFAQLPSLRLGPFVDRVGTNRAVISFATDAATAAWVAVFDDRRQVRLVASASTGVDHEIPLTELKSGTRYRYQVVVVDARGEVHIHRGATLETEPEGLSRFEIVALSDSRSGFGAADEQYGGTNARVLGDLLKMSLARGHPRAIVFVGDLIDGYTTWPRSFAFQLEMWKRAVQPVHAHVPIYEVMGNHEALLDVWSNGWGANRQVPSAEEVFAAQFVNPPGGPSAPEGAPPYGENTYSTAIGTAHLAMVNSNYHYRSHPGNQDHPAGPVGNREGWLDDTTLAWLDADLAAARKAGRKHLFVFTHEPGFPNGGHVHDGMYWNGEVPEVLRQRAKLYAVLGRHAVTAIVHGDEHNYSRVLVDAEILGAELERPVWHLVSGGAGAPFYAQDQSVPWSHRVEAFDARQHYLRFLIDGDDCTIEAVSREGGIIDRFDAADVQRNRS